MGEKLVTVELTGLDSLRAQLVDALIHEGELRERERIVDRLESYFDLTRYSVEVEGAEENKEWDAGFQAALALTKADDA